MLLQKKIDNLICTIDLNGQQIDGSTDDVLPMGSLEAKFLAFGFDVINEKEGNSVEKVLSTLKNAKSRLGKGKPVCVLLHTKMGNGVDFMMDSHKWHGVAPNDQQLKDALDQNKETLGDY